MAQSLERHARRMAGSTWMLIAAWLGLRFFLLVLSLFLSIACVILVLYPLICVENMGPQTLVLFSYWAAILSSCSIIVLVNCVCYSGIVPANMRGKHGSPNPILSLPDLCLNVAGSFVAGWS